MHLLRAALAVLFALALAVPAEATPEARIQVPAQLFVSGLHANEVEPIVHGLVLESAHVLVYAGCYLALASEDTCVQIAGAARMRLE